MTLALDPDNYRRHQCTVGFLFSIRRSIGLTINNYKYKLTKQERLHSMKNPNTRKLLQATVNMLANNYVNRTEEKINQVQWQRRRHICVLNFFHRMKRGNIWGYQVKRGRRPSVHGYLCVNFLQCFIDTHPSSSLDRWDEISTTCCSGYKLYEKRLRPQNFSR